MLVQKLVKIDSHPGLEKRLIACSLLLHLHLLGIQYGSSFGSSGYKAGVIVNLHSLHNTNVKIDVVAMVTKVR